MESVIPDQLENETAKAYRAFMDYCLMRSNRSLPKLHRIYTKPSQEIPPTRHLRTLKEWSTSHHWQARVAEYEKRLAETRDERQEKRRIVLEEQSTIDHDRMLAEWDRRWGILESAPGAVNYSELYSLIKLRREIDDFGRRAVGLPDKVTENTVKGTGERDAIVFAVSGIDLESDI